MAYETCCSSVLIKTAAHISKISYQIMELVCEVDSTGVPALSRVNYKQQSSEIFERLTSVNEEMPQLLQGMRYFTLQLCFYSTLFWTDSAAEIKITKREECS